MDLDFRKITKKFEGGELGKRWKMKGKMGMLSL